MKNFDVEYLWVEKYRPKVIDDVVLPDKYRSEFRGYISDRQIPSMIFSGPPGSGKTTCARVLCSPYGVISNPEDNVLSVNGSARDSRGIGYMSDVIEPFIKIPPMGEDIIKIVFIDEVDNMTADSFKSFRAISEKYSRTSRFLFTANYYNRIPEPVQSRLSCYMFKQVPKEFVKNYCNMILDTEGIKRNENDVDELINLLYPDIRKIVSSLQTNITDNILNLDLQSVILLEPKICSLVVDLITCIKNKQNDKAASYVKDISTIVTSEELNYRDIYENLFIKCPDIIAKIIVNKYCNSHNECLISSMHFMAMIYEIVQKLDNFTKLIT